MSRQKCILQCVRQSSQSEVSASKRVSVAWYSPFFDPPSQVQQVKSLNFLVLCGFASCSICWMNWSFAVRLDMIPTVWVGSAARWDSPGLFKWNFELSNRWLWWTSSFGMFCHPLWQTGSNVSGEPAASIFYHGKWGCCFLGNDNTQPHPRPQQSTCGTLVYCLKQPTIREGI